VDDDHYELKNVYETPEEMIGEWQEPTSIYKTMIK
jgi:hypothetical protein